MKSLEIDYEVYGLSCYANLHLFEEQIEKFRPVVVAVGSENITQSDEYRSLKNRFSEIEFLEGDEGIQELAGRKVNILVSAIVGAAALKPTLAAIPVVDRIALANKETLVMAGNIFMERVKEFGTELIPVDSEHSAIFSLINNMKRDDIRKMVLTASGGSLRDRPSEELGNVTPEEALAHPTWDMGSKITIDSATMMNKGFEVIECHHLFDVEYDDIDVVVHPESIIHAMVETTDGALHAYLSAPDMAHPILNAIIYPAKKDNSFGRIDLLKIGHLSFMEQDSNKFPALDICYSAGRAGGTMPAVLNAANETAVYAFLNKRIAYTDIVKVIERTLELNSPISDPDINDIFEADKWARKISENIMSK